MSEILGEISRPYDWETYPLTVKVETAFIPVSYLCQQIFNLVGQRTHGGNYGGLQRLMRIFLSVSQWLGDVPQRSYVVGGEVIPSGETKRSESYQYIWSAISGLEKLKITY